MTAEQARAFDQLRGFAKPFRYRVVADHEGFPIIPCRHGQIEWTGESGETLAAYTDGRLMRGRLLALPWIDPLPRQVGDSEVRVYFPAERLPDMAALLKARVKRRGLSSEAARKRSGLPTVRASLRPQERTGVTPP